MSPKYAFFRLQSPVPITILVMLYIHINICSWIAWNYIVRLGFNFFQIFIIIGKFRKIWLSAERFWSKKTWTCNYAGGYGRSKTAPYINYSYYSALTLWISVCVPHELLNFAFRAGIILYDDTWWDGIYTYQILSLNKP